MYGTVNDTLTVGPYSIGVHYTRGCDRAEAIATLVGLECARPKSMVPWEPQTTAEGYQAAWVDGSIGFNAVIGQEEALALVEEEEDRHNFF